MVGLDEAAAFESSALMDEDTALGIIQDDEARGGGGGGGVVDAEAAAAAVAAPGSFPARMAAGRRLQAALSIARARAVTGRDPDPVV